MNQFPNSILSRELLVTALLGWLAITASAQSALTNAIWTSTGSGIWGDLSNWLGDVPTLASAVTITNAPSKTVTVNATTPTENRAARRIDLSAPPGSTNSLRFDNLGTTRFVLANTCAIETGGRIEISNSTLEVDGTLGGNFNVWAGDVQLLGGTLITTNNAVMRVGRTGVGRMDINDGQLLTATNLSVGSLSGSDGALTLVSGLAQVDGQFTVADEAGSVGRVHIVSGALVSTNAVASIGDDGNGTLQVSGGSVAFSGVSVGRTGIGLTVLTGGELLTSGDAVIGEFAGSDGTFTISNGLARVGGELAIGDNPSAIGRLNVAGGTLIATNAALTTRVGDDGDGTMTVSAGDVFFDSVSVGRASSSVGRLLVRGGTINSASVSVGRFAGSQGILEVTGGQLKLEGSSLYVGREGNGTAVISNGTVRTARTLVAAVSGASGSLQLSGGTLITGELSANQNGQIQFNAGRLETRATTVANGAPFVVGDGVQAATLHLDGGVHAFANGLTISSKATLTGTGTVLGQITVLTGGSNQLGTALAPVVLTPLAEDGPFRFSFPSTIGKLYEVLSTTNLAQAPWQTHTTLTGDGAMLTFTNPLPGPQRYFRLLVH